MTDKIISLADSFYNIYISIFYCLVSIILIKFINFFFRLKLIGALTSKPFAYKARSWELSSTFIVDFTSCFNDKIRVDLKGLEIMRILPWLNSTITENWISDKIWFSYDGLSLNWISKFFFRKKFLLLTKSLLILNLIDPLQLKYFNILINNSNIKKISTYKNMQSLLEYYSLVLKFLNFAVFKSIKFDFKFDNLLSNSLSSNIFPHLPKYFLIDFNLFNYENSYSSVINIFFFLRKKIFRVKNIFFLKKFQTFLSLPVSKCYGLGTLNFLNLNKKKKINIFLNSNLDALTCNFANKTLNYLDKNLKTKKIGNLLNFFSFNTNINFNYIWNKLSILKNFTKFNNCQILILINSNIRVINPRLHILLWKYVKEKDLLILSFGNIENLLFKHVNFGNKLKDFLNLINGRHWLTSFFTKRINYLFFLNIDLNKFLPSKIYYLKKLEFINFFVTFSIKQKLFYVSNYYCYPLSSANWINNLQTLNFLFNKKKTKNLTFRYRDFSYVQSELNIFNNYNMILVNKFLKIYSTNNFRPKQDFIFLLETNILSTKLNLIFDIIFPLTNLGENFLLIKNFFSTTNKSLFFKLGPWYSRTLFNYLNFFYLLSIFPFYFFLKKNSVFKNINFLFLTFWLQGTCFVNLNVVNKKLINFNTIKNHNLKYFKKINFLNFQNQFSLTILNTWFSEISYINSSKYATLGYSLIKQEKKTFILNY